MRPGRPAEVNDAEGPATLYPPSAPLVSHVFGLMEVPGITEGKFRIGNISAAP